MGSTSPAKHQRPQLPPPTPPPPPDQRSCWHCLDPWRSPAPGFLLKDLLLATSPPLPSTYSYWSHIHHGRPSHHTGLIWVCGIQIQKTCAPAIVLPPLGCVTPSGPCPDSPLPPQGPARPRTLLVRVWGLLRNLEGPRVPHAPVCCPWSPGLEGISKI